MAPTRRACGFVIFRRLRGNVEYLLMQTSYGKHHWTPPKGHVDPGESDMETALRETEEEAGYVKSDLKIIDSAKKELNYPVNNKPKIVIYWLAELLNKTKDVTMSKEHQDFKWLPLKEACELAVYPEMQETFAYFDKYITENLVQ
ncbi:bis(5'-nucleosyl)-tetraphosphatase [asymmetrical] [Nasonia vitripennis]|uniref:Bis(5'-nucleosyl)-tetraphosphatase [asymmetrical] n=1 Tax=Nasonia vitripennis TaxID=7425 RepID=A0A7M7G8E6_NASVI|nr:bis(5'-nucleosyl)-tetraphosphatase [asymmetrical] [Nasonia vitripennis]